MNGETAIPELFPYYRRRHDDRGAGRDRCPPLFEGCMRAYSAFSEEALRSRNFSEGLVRRRPSAPESAVPAHATGNRHAISAAPTFFCALSYSSLPRSSWPPPSLAVFCGFSLATFQEHATSILLLITLLPSRMSAAEVRRLPGPPLSLRDRGSPRRLLRSLPLRGNAVRIFRKPRIADATRGGNGIPWFPPPACHRFTLDMASFRASLCASRRGHLRHLAALATGPRPLSAQHLIVAAFLCSRPDNRSPATPPLSPHVPPTASIPSSKRSSGSASI